jgi:hypothetical protein
MFPMNYLRSEYSYGFRDLVQAKVRALNFYGWSRAYSQPNSFGATVRTEPEAPAAIFVNAP